MLGLTVLAVVPLRLLTRQRGPAPAVTPPLARWQRRLANGIHIALYALMIVMVPLLHLSKVFLMRRPGPLVSLSTP